MIAPVQGLGATSFTASLDKAGSKATTGMQPTAESFADVMSSMATGMVGNLKNAETTSTDGIMGKASAREVVDAVMTADQTLQTAIAFRDKIVTAYLEVIKMPI